MAVSLHSTDTRCYYVIHPLDDAPEEKRDPMQLGPMPMSRSVRFSLLALRGYLILMVLLVFYHVITLAGILHPVH